VLCAGVKLGLGRTQIEGFEKNRVLSRMFGPERDEVTGGRRK
jgi:hypothetical protein